MDSAYVAVKQSLELTESEQPIFKQLDIDKTLTHKLARVIFYMENTSRALYCSRLPF